MAGGLPFDRSTEPPVPEEADQDEGDEVHPPVTGREFNGVGAGDGAEAEVRGGGGLCYHDG